MHLPEGPLVVIDSRRCSLLSDENSSWGDHVEEVDGKLRLLNGSGGIYFPCVLDGPVLVHYEPDTEYTIGGRISPYEEIGLELVKHVEAREAARAGSEERERAQEELDRFLDELAISVRGRPTILRELAARKIFEEGCRLINVCWQALRTEISLTETTKNTFASYGIPLSAMFEWAIRLVLPNFSIPELKALQRQIAEPKQYPGPVSPPREFTVHVLAHRLGEPVATVARKVMHGWDAEMVEAHGEACMICKRRHTG
jgi:hypothetical protein